MRRSVMMFVSTHRVEQKQAVREREDGWGI
jgi:hypothetical protein